MYEKDEDGKKRRKKESTAYSYPNESFSGCDMVAQVLIQVGEEKIVHTLGELQTMSYSIHMDRSPVRSIGNINAKDYVMGPRTIAGSLVFAVFNKHFAYKIMDEVKEAIKPEVSFLIDELPPFDIVVSYANEYGIRSRLVIYGVRLVNEGQVMSINDIYTENTYQFVATDLEYLSKENEYTAGGKRYKGAYVIKGDDDVPFAGKIVPNFKAGVKNSDINLELNYKVKSMATVKKKGLVDLWLTPTKRDGTITISGKKKKYKIDVAESITGNNKVAVQLEAGEYSAVWKKGKEKSNTVNFEIAKETIVQTDYTAAPIIECVGDTYVRIYSNVRSHTKAIYKDDEGNRFSVTLAGRKALIQNLTPNTKYEISTSNDDLKKESKTVKVITNPIGFDAYSSFIEYLRYNKKALKNSNFDIYMDIVYTARTIATSGIRYESITDTFVEVLKKYSAELSALEPIKFPNIFEYEDAKKHLNALIKATSELLSISSKITSDEVYGYNYNTKVVDPPILEDYKGCTNTFIVSKETSALEFFRQFTKNSQHDKTIKSSSFSDAGSNYRCTFNGRPSTAHYTYAENEHGFRSPKVEFYVYSNEDRIEEIEKRKSDIQQTNYTLEHIRSNIGFDIANKYSVTDTTRILTEIATESKIKKAKAPIVSEINESSIVIKVQDLNILSKINANVVLSKVDEALINNPKYKIPVDEIVTFTVYKHGVRPGTDYCIWIEDAEGTQITDSVTAKTLDIDEDNSEYTIKKYFIDKIMDELKETMDDDGVLSPTIDNILYVNKSDVDMNKSNILDLTIELIMAESVVLSEMYEMLYSYYKYYYQKEYTVLESIFERNLMIDDSNLLHVYEDCYAEKIDLSINGVTKNFIELSAGDSIQLCNEKHPYTIISFIDKNLNRGGFVLISNYNERCITSNLVINTGE